jgi:spore coat protein U-like protein
MAISKRYIAAAVLAALVGAGSADLADANTTGNFAVSMTIVGSCSVATNPLAFGTVSTGTAGAATANTTLSVTCPTGVAYNIGLQSQNAGGSGGAGQMNNGGSHLVYNLYQNAADTTAWGNTVGTNTVAATGTNAAQTQTVYGQVAQSAVNGASTGNYTDTVTVTVFY